MKEKLRNWMVVSNTKIEKKLIHSFSVRSDFQLENKYTHCTICISSV